MICVNEQSPIIVTLFCLPECLCEFFPYTVTDAEREWVRGREREKWTADYKYNHMLMMMMMMINCDEQKKSDDIWKQKGNMNILLDIITEICVFCWILFILSSREREKEELFFYYQFWW